MILIFEKHAPFVWIYTKSFAWIRESFALFCKSYALFRESFALFCKSFALIRECPHYFASFKFIRESVSQNLGVNLRKLRVYNFFLYENEPTRLSYVWAHFISCDENNFNSFSRELWRGYEAIWLDSTCFSLRTGLE